MQAWHLFIKNLSKQMDESIINKWIRSLEIKKFDARNIYLEAVDIFQAHWIKEHILLKAQKELKNSNGQPIKIHLSVKNAPNKTKKQIIKKEVSIFTPEELSDFYSFDSFFSDKQNELTVQLLKQVSQNKQSEELFFNPIFIYGPSGSGKTHLLTSVAKEISKQGKNIFFTSAQTFTEHVVKAFRLSLLHEFRNTYRNVEILIVDDIHLLAGKAATQEEFFHTFNTLHSQNCQIILSSNSIPGKLTNIEQRLISRFEWGITLPLNAVDKKALPSILKTKEKHFSLNLAEETRSFLLETFSSSNSLQTAIQALVIRSSDSFKKFKTPPPIDVYHAKEWLKDLMEQQKKNQITPSFIIEVTAKHFDISADDILGKTQTKEYSLPRQLSMYFCREKLNLPYKKIGEIFNRDHSTVMTNVKYILKQKNSNTPQRKINFFISEIEQKLKN